ncbi:cell division protein SepF [Rothia nasimurium]|uniref:cell division protein SepF n=1 Tax=Rothia nasimurium TaxID=85336 RepID=UPI003B9FB8DB
MARTIQQALAYLGLSHSDEETERQAHARRPQTVYEETVYEPVEAGKDIDENSYDGPADQQRIEEASAQRDVLLGLESPAPARPAQPRPVAAAPVSADPFADEAEEDLLELDAAPSGDHDRSRRAPSWEPAEAASAQATLSPLPAKTPSNTSESSEELRQITTIHPRSYNDAKIIGESFRENIPVIMNVTEMGEADAKRLIDFSSGLAFALNGSIERVTDKVFLLTPANLEVLGAEGTEVPVALDGDDVTPFNHF